MPADISVKGRDIVAAVLVVVAVYGLQRGAIPGELATGILVGIASAYGFSTVRNRRKGGSNNSGE